jgi:DNA-binding NtrC family response regulator
MKIIIAKPKIMVVDDEIYPWQTFGEFLSSKGIPQVRVTYSVEEAILIMKESIFIPDILITEIRFDNTGLKVVREAARLNPLARVIYITSYAQMVENFDEIKRLCVWSWLQKPFDNNKLYFHVLCAMGRNREARKFMNGCYEANKDINCRR